MNKFLVFLVAPLFLVGASASAKAMAPQGDSMNQVNLSVNETQEQEAENVREQALKQEVEREMLQEQKEEGKIAGEEGVTSTGNVNGGAGEKGSVVSQAVQKLLDVADRNGGIGEQVRVIAQAQNDVVKETADSLEKIRNRNTFLRILIGPSYQEIKKAKSLIDKSSEGIEQIRQIKDNLQDKADQQKMEEQIGLLEQANLQFQAAVQNLEKNFSLFGWLAKLLVK